MFSPQANVEEIFSHAVDLHDGDQQNAYLDEACKDNKQLRAAIELLLRHDEEVGGFLSQPVIATATHNSTLEKPGTQIGPYKLLQEIGEGGMGVVYMAEQTTPVERRVALKIIKPGMDTRQVVARFESERQALALMDHPNIARVLDAGETDTGRPYFVMELVHGLPITKYCDQKHLHPKQRLQLFIPICQAIQHAHQKGIVHRDLKPSNILVALYDGRPVPKVIDFGVAKATSRKLTEKTMFTQFGQIVGTLEYMSPEQAELNQLDIDTRSDIYSLGVLLYELLTGQTPFDGEQLRSAGFAEMLRIIREDDPPPPSTRIKYSDELPSIAENRQLGAVKLGSLVQGELDWIVMKSLEKERARRYETASEFASDIQRYLEDEPVLACPPSTTYRLRKFLGRNRALVGTVAMIMALLIVGIAGTSWQAQRATSQRKRAETQQKRAEQAEKQATARLDKALAAVDQMLTRVGEIKLEHVPAATEVRREILNDALNFYNEFLQELPDDSRLRLETSMIQRRLARILFQLGDTEKATASIQVAIDLLDRELVDSPGNVTILMEQAKNYSAASSFAVKETRTEHLEKAVAILEGLFESGGLGREARAELAYVSSLLVQSQKATLGMAEAVELFENAENHFRAVLKESSDDRHLRRQFAKHLQNFGILLIDHGQLDSAEVKYHEALDIANRLMENEDRRVEDRLILAMAFTNLGSACTRQQRDKEAVEFHKQAIDVERDLVRDFPSVPDYRLRLSGSLMSLAGIYSLLEESEQGIAHAEEAAELTKYLTGTWPEVNKYHIIRGGALSNLAMLLSQEDSDLERAEQLALEAIDLQKHVLQANPDQTTANTYLLNHHYTLVKVRIQLGRHEDAQAACAEGEKLGVCLTEKYPNNKGIQNALNGLRRMSKGIKKGTTNNKY